MKKSLFLAMGLLSTIAIAQTGNVGINTEKPTATLNVKSKTGTTNATKNLELQNANGTILASVSDDGQVKLPLLPVGTSVDNKVIVVAQDGTLKLIDRATLNSSISYDSSTSVTINGNEIQRAALSGDVTANVNSNVVTINNGAITNDKIANGTIDISKIKVTSNENGKVLVVRNGQLVFESINSISDRKCRLGDIPYYRQRTRTEDPNEMLNEGTIRTTEYDPILRYVCINAKWTYLFSEGAGVSGQ